MNTADPFVIVLRDTTQVLCRFPDIEQPQWWSGPPVRARAETGERIRFATVQAADAFIVDMRAMYPNDISFATGMLVRRYVPSVAERFVDPDATLEAAARETNAELASLRACRDRAVALVNRESRSCRECGEPVGLQGNMAMVLDLHVEDAARETVQVADLVPRNLTIDCPIHGKESALDGECFTCLCNEANHVACIRETLGIRPPLPGIKLAFDVLSEAVEAGGFSASRIVERLREKGVPVTVSDLHGHGLQAVANAISDGTFTPPALAPEHVETLRKFGPFRVEDPYSGVIHGCGDDEHGAGKLSLVVNYHLCTDGSIRLATEAVCEALNHTIGAKL